MIQCQEVTQAEQWAPTRHNVPTAQYNKAIATHYARVSHNTHKHGITVIGFSHIQGKVETHQHGENFPIRRYLNARVCVVRGKSTMAKSKVGKKLAALGALRESYYY